MKKEQTTVILTHPVGADDLLYQRLQLGGVPVVCDPMISTQEILLSEADLERIQKSRRILFTSKRGVEYFVKQTKPASILDKSIICVGRKTAHALEQYDLEPWWVSNGRSASDLVSELHQLEARPNELWTAILSELADDTLQDGLHTRCNFQRINIYKTAITQSQNKRSVEVLKAPSDCIVVCTSPSCFSGFMNNYSSLLHNRVKFASIGPITTQSMRNKNIEPSIIAKFSSYEALWHSIQTDISKSITIKT
jgi:uroporphyrinogen-III synthase